MGPVTIDSISHATFKKVLKRYPSTVPDKLRELDTLRYETIPGAVANRAAEEKGGAYLKAEEVEKLVEWKLKHGTFRPKLLSLVQSNPSKTLEETTRRAFKALKTANVASTVASVKSLTQLKGIGPATASLLLAVYAPDSVPFFSDEVFRWMVWSEPGAPRGWQRAIKYNMREYEVLVERVGGLRKRLGEGVRAVDVERVAWVLGKQGVDVDVGLEEDAEDGKKEEQAEDENQKNEKEEAGQVAEKDEQSAKQKAGFMKGVKRKTEDKEGAPVEGLRRSTRRKTEN